MGPKIVLEPGARSRDPVLTFLVTAIAAHSLAVGATVVTAPAWGARFGGWGEVTPLFFLRQFGVFHFVVAAAYLVEYFRYGGVTILLIAKAIAVVSLVDAMFRFGVPWAVPMAAAGDAAMGLAVWWRASSRGGVA